MKINSIQLKYFLTTRHFGGFFTFCHYPLVADLSINLYCDLSRVLERVHYPNDATDRKWGEKASVSRHPKSEKEKSESGREIPFLLFCRKEIHMLEDTRTRTHTRGGWMVILTLVFLLRRIRKTVVSSSTRSGTNQKRCENTSKLKQQVIVINDY